MLSAFTQAFRTPDLRAKLLFTLGIMALFRLGSILPAPGVNLANAKYCIGEAGKDQNLLSLVNVFSGGALLQLSVFALGIMPYITASIIIQLLRVVIPRFEELHKEGQAGTAKLTEYTRYLTIGLGLLQSSTIVATAKSGQLFQGCARAQHIVAGFGNQTSKWVQWILTNLQQTSPIYLTAYGVLILFFAFFYTAITFDAEEIADNMKRYGGFIPGIRAGEPTVRYLSYVINRITTAGSIYLVVLALIPTLAVIWLDLAQHLPFGGTTILIMVGVGLQTVKEVNSQLQQRHYEGFLS